MTDNISPEQLKREIEKIAEYLSQAKMEIAAIARPEGETGSAKNILHAAEELHEVVRHTEEATNGIMDHADAIIQLAGGMGDAGLGGKFNDHALGILEACSFQDITGQRIKKVLKTLEQVEVRLNNLINLFGGTLPNGIDIKEVDIGAKRADEALMNGPQLGGQPGQDDIDRLFSSL